MKTRVINMVMLGPSRVGKSSLLATMYQEISQMRVGFKLKPNDDTRGHMEDAYKNLSKVIEQLVFSPVEDLLKGTINFIEHRFEVVFRQRTEFDLVFHDFRGGAMMESGNDYNTLSEKVKRSHVIFNVLDAVSLMELNATMCEQRNGHERVRQLLEQAFQPGQKYLINFVLVKCESYIKTASGREQLIKRFEKRHDSVLRLIEKNQSNVVGLLFPVTTLGCVEFKEIDSNGNYIFERNRKKFEPRDVDQPLRYALGFALKHVDENRWFGERILGRLSGRRDRFAQALEDFYRDRKEPSRIYGNKKLLEVT